MGTSRNHAVATPQQASSDNVLAARPTGDPSGSGTRRGSRNRIESQIKLGGNAAQPRVATSAAGQTSSGGADSLDAEIQGFVSQHPQGWNHEDWEGFLGHLREGGQEVADPDQIGQRLERHRLEQTLSQVEGLEEGQRRAIGERFGSVWNLRSAQVEDLSDCANCPPDVAERIRNSVIV